MADDELLSLIRERQRRAECEAAGIPYVPDELAVRKAPHCDPAIEPRPDVLVGPNTAPTPTPPDRLLPPPLVVRSPEVLVMCQDYEESADGVGSIVVPYGETDIDLYLDDIAQLTRSELYRIYSLHAALQAALDANLENLIVGAITAAQFDAALVAAAAIESAAASGIRTKAVELRGGPGNGFGATGLYAISQLTGLSRLECQYGNDPLWVVCDSESATGFSTFFEEPSPLPDPDYYRYRGASAVFSTISKEDANNTAALEAASEPGFECVYVSEEQTVTCADLDPAFDHAYSPPFAWDGNDYASLAELGAANFSAYSLDSLTAPRSLVYSVTVVAGLFPSSSQEEANEKARAAGLRQLDCFFPSRAAEINCANRSESNPVTERMIEGGLTQAQVFAEMDAEYLVNPDLVTNFGVVQTVPGPGAEIDTSEGLIVQIPAGMVVALTNQADADAEARLHALGFLACRWVSPAVDCTCDDLWSPAELDEYNVDLSPNSNASISFAKGDLGSSEDGPIAAGDAMDLCLASLNCIYCNRTKEPRCHLAFDEENAPYDLWEPQSDLGLPLSLTTLDGVSTGVSSGLPAGAICDADPRLVDTLAESTGLIPPPVNGVGGEPVCRYGNREIQSSCPEKVGGQAFALTPESAARTMVVTAGSFDAPTQTEADALAQAFLNAALICEFGSPPMTVLCGAVVNTAAPIASDYATPVTYGDGQDVIAPGSVGGLGNPLTIAAHAYTSLESATSAKAQAMLSLIAQLNCFWRSPRIDVLCGSPTALPPEFYNTPENADPSPVIGDNALDYCPDSTGDVADEAVAAAFSAVSYISQADANQQAYRIARDQLDCFWQSARIELMCGAPAVMPPLLGNTDEAGTIDVGDNAPDYSDASTGSSAGEVFLVAKSVVSYNSQAEANRRAYSEAYLQLDCFWENARVDLRCTAPSVMPGIYAGLSEVEVIQEGDIIIGPPREPNGIVQFSADSVGFNWGDVVVEAQTIASYNSQSDANLQAYRQAWAMLDCFFRSAEVQMSCTPARFPSVQQLITPETGTIFDISEPDIMITESKAITSYRNQSDANSQAYQITRAQLNCDSGKDHAYGVSGYGTFACCKVKFGELMMDAGQTVLYSPLDPGTGLSNTIPGFEKLEPDIDGAEACGTFPAYFYLEAYLHDRGSGDTYARYYTTSCEVKVYQSEQPALEGTEGSYTKVRRLIAHADQPNANSTLNRGAADDCAGLKIVQLVTAPQKLTSSDMGGVIVPTITDVDSPIGGGGAAPTGCDNLRFYTQSSGGTVNLWRTAGSIGGSSYAAANLGALSSNYNKYLFAKFTMSGDSYSSELLFTSSTPSSSSTVGYVMLASVGPEGQLYKHACGASASVCRNWYAGSAPYYSMTVSAY